MLLLFLIPFVVIAPSSQKRENTPTETPEQDPASASPTTLSASQLLARALQQREIGNDDSAAQDFHTLLQDYPAANESRQARYYQAESFARRSRWTSAVETFDAFVAESTSDDLFPPALFWLARSYEEIGDWAKAIAVYERYRALHTPLEPYAAIRQAAQYQAMGQLAEAAQNYEYVASTDIDRAQRAASFEKAITLYRELGNRDQAFVLFEELLVLAQLPGYRARMLLEAALFAQEIGKQDQANAWLHEIVTAIPTSPQAITAIEMLQDKPESPLLPQEIAHVYFLAERYTEAKPFFDAFYTPPVAGAVDDPILEGYRLRAMNLRGIGKYSESLDALAEIVVISPDSEPGRQARLDWIQTLGQSGETSKAADAYREYAATYPDDPRAPIALDRAAQLFERLQQYDTALQTRLDLEQRYPTNDLSPYHLHAVAFSLFQRESVQEAQNIWQRIAEGREGYLKALGSFWAARCALHQNQSEQAEQLLEAAALASPESYYGARAIELLCPDDSKSHPACTSIAVQHPAIIGTPIEPLAWQTLQEWVDSWADPNIQELSSQSITTTHQYMAHLVQSHVISRAVGLETVGLLNESMAEWNYARDLWSDDPFGLLVLARRAYEHNTPYIALKAAEQITSLAPPEAFPSPYTLHRLIYPVPYSTIVIDQSQGYDVAPQLLYALIRQESLFNPHATSWVGARGLGQVMPATGEGIAQQLKIEGFTIDDLYRPAVSVQFAAYYISQQIAMMNGNIQAGLSAYNGGPGNALRWADGDQVGDVDLFTESIDYAETRNYVKRVYGYYLTYQRLYTLP